MKTQTTRTQARPGSAKDDFQPFPRLKDAAPPLSLVNFDPPQAIEAERVLLAAMMLWPAELEKWSQELTAADFYRPHHQALFAALQGFSRQDVPIDASILPTDLTGAGVLEACGGAEYLASIFVSDPYQAHTGLYAGRVREAAKKRLIADSAIRLIESAQSGASAEEMTTQAEQLVSNSPLTASEYSQDAKQILLALSDKIDQQSENPNALLGLPSGFRNIDAVLNGLQAPNLIVIGARPGVGKTGLLCNMAAYTARMGEPTLLFSMEMSNEEVMLRMICSEASVSSHSLRSGRLTEAEWDRYNAAARALYNAPLVVSEKSGCTPSYLRAEVRKFIRCYGRVSLIGVDYVQLMRCDRPTRDRLQELTEVSIGLKEIAREFHVPVVALAQLSRECEKRQDKRGILSDLRETGQLEQDADIVGFLYREDMYAPAPQGYEDAARQMPVELLIRKHRNGPTGTIRLDYVAPFTLFMDQAETTGPTGY